MQIKFIPIDTIQMSPSTCTLTSFIDTLNSCSICPGKESSTHPVSPDGNISSFISFHGKEPISKDVDSNVPFHPSTPCGALFNKYLSVLGCLRSGSYVSNSFFCKTPHPETFPCFKLKQMEYYLLSKCKVFILLGNDSYSQYLGQRANSVASDLGTIFVYRDKWFVPLTHPIYSLRDPDIFRNTLTFLYFFQPVLKKFFENHVKNFLN